MNLSPAEIRGALLAWLYDRARVSTLPQSETAMLNGLRREGTEIALPELREAVDFLTDSEMLAVVKGSMGGGRAQWTWRITAKGKIEREAMP